MIVELQRFCEERRSLEAAFSPTQLPRVLDSVADTTGGVSMQVRGSVDAWGRPALDVRISGELTVLCQRCMRPLVLPVAVGQTLAFGDEDADESVDPDSVEVLPMMSHVDLVELLEEEVLLALPMLPRHIDCGIPGPAASSRPTPFAALQGLLGTGGDAGDRGKDDE